MIAVTSADGKLTRGNDSDIYKWTSREDQDFFFDQIKHSKLIVMGSGTYESVRKNLKLDIKDRLRIVLSNSPEKYLSEQQDSLLEFSSETPKNLVERLSDKYDEMLLVGGAKVYSSFIQEGLIDEIYLTVEPVIFGDGKKLFDQLDFEVKLKLQTIKKLNSNGTLLIKYKVEK